MRFPFRSHPGGVNQCEPPRETPFDIAVLEYIKDRHRKENTFHDQDHTQGKAWECPLYIEILPEARRKYYCQVNGYGEPRWHRTSDERIKLEMAAVAMSAIFDGLRK